MEIVKVKTIKSTEIKGDEGPSNDVGCLRISGKRSVVCRSTGHFDPQTEGTTDFCSEAAAAHGTGARAAVLHRLDALGVKDMSAG